MNKIYTAVALSLATMTLSAQQNAINDVLAQMGKETMVIIRQDYQLIDDDDNVKNAPGKDYWKRSYALGLRVGDDRYMITDESVKPWSKDGLSKKDKFQPVVSSTAFRPLEALEFDEIEFDSDQLTEIQENRIYTFGGSEIAGASVIAPEGTLQTYLVVAENTRSSVFESGETVDFKIEVIPASFNFVENKSIYDLKTQLPNSTFGGFAVTPVKLRPGLVDYCVIGMLQKVGGIWKLISVSEGTLIHQSDTPGEYNLDDVVDTIMKGMDSEMNSFLEAIGLNTVS